MKSHLKNAASVKNIVSEWGWCFDLEQWLWQNIKNTFFAHPLGSALAAPPSTAKPRPDQVSRRRLLRENVCGLGTQVTYSESASLALSTLSWVSVWMDSGFRRSALDDSRRDSWPRIISCLLTKHPVNQHITIPLHYKLYAVIIPHHYTSNWSNR